jgi:hypothetical protein
MVTVPISERHEGNTAAVFQSSDGRKNPTRKSFLVMSAFVADQEWYGVPVILTG